MSTEGFLPQRAEVVSSRLSIYNSSFVNSILKICKKKPISFEVFADNPKEMLKQAYLINKWGKNVYVKIPVTNSKGNFMGKIIKVLNNQNIKNGIEVTSPIIGTAYHAPEPGAKKFIEVGKKIKKGDTIMIVEAMKTMNHVPSSSDGVVKEICIDDLSLIHI